MLFLLFLSQEIGASTTTSCDSKCSWNVFNWDDTIATVTASGYTSNDSKVNMAFDGNNEMNSIFFNRKRRLFEDVIFNQVLVHQK